MAPCRWFDVYGKLTVLTVDSPACEPCLRISLRNSSLLYFDSCAAGGQHKHVVGIFVKVHPNPDNRVCIQCTKERFSIRQHCIIASLDPQGIKNAFSGFYPRDAFLKYRVRKLM